MPMNNQKMRMAQSVKRKPIKKGTIKRLFGYIFKKYKFLLFIVFISIIITSIIDVCAQVFIKTVIDDYITPLVSSKIKDYMPLIKVLLKMGAILSIGVIANYLYQRLMVTISQGVLKDIRDEMFEKMQKFSIGYFHDNSTGDIMSHYTNDTDTLRQMISQSIPQTFASIITIIAVIISMIYLNPLLTLIVIICLSSILFITKKLAKKSSKHFALQQESLGKVNGFIEEMIDGAKVVKVFNHEDINQKEFNKLNNKLCTNATKANIYANMLMPLMGNLTNLTYVIVAIFGGVLAICTDMFITIGLLASFLTLTKSFMNPISRISQQINFILVALSGAERIFDLMDNKPEENNGIVTLVNINEKMKETKKQTGSWAWKKDNELIPLKGDVRFNDVTFGYKKDKTILKNISLYAKPGHKIAFVGSTGAGKTTIMNLINNFYSIKDGSITYDGIDINDINKNALRLSLGMVLQETNLFTGTIMDNIRYGNSNATDKECIEASKLANAHQFIEKLPDGYNTVITDNGSNLSQGQRQLISIARCAVLNPPVMILDEATSSIDTRTEKIIQNGMDKLMKGRTVFVIAHRLSTIKNSNAIMVLENGKIIERGTHEDLLKLKGEYYDLYTGAKELD